MNIDDMTMPDVVERLAALDVEVRDSQDVEFVKNATEEKRQLLEKQAFLEDLESRKKTALELEAGKVPDKIIEVRKESKKMEFEKMRPEEIRATEEYKSAFLKRLMGRDLNDIEKRVNEMASTDVAGVIPTVTARDIISKAKQYSPLLSEITLFQIPGNMTIAVEGTNNAAALHSQNTAITPAADTLGSVSLGGYEIVKVLRISATVKNMAIPEFENWLIDYLAEGIAAKVGAYILYGSGSSQPKGIDYSVTWTDNSNAVQWAGATPTAAELIELISYLKGGYHKNAKFLMNSKTFWGNIAAIQDNSKFKILTDDYKRILGYPVLLDDQVNDGDIFFGDCKRIVGNLSAPITVESSAHSGFLNNAVDFRGATLFDCDFAFNECFVKSAATIPGV